MGWVKVTTFRWDASRDLVSLLEDLHTLREKGEIAPDDLIEQKRELLGVPEPIVTDEINIQVWKIGKWLTGRAGASLSRTDDPAWQVERLQRLRDQGMLTNSEFSYLERELLHPQQATLIQRLRDLRELRRP